MSHHSSPQPRPYRELLSDICRWANLPDGAVIEARGVLATYRAEPFALLGADGTEVPAPRTCELLFNGVSLTQLAALSRGSLPEPSSGLRDSR